jgi:hypothetical protein
MSYLLVAVIEKDQTWWEWRYKNGSRGLIADYNSRRPRYTFWSLGSLSNLVEGLSRISVKPPNRFNKSIRILPFDVVSENMKKRLFPDFFTQEKLFVKSGNRYNLITEDDIRFKQASKHGLSIENKSRPNWPLHYFESKYEKWYVIESDTEKDKEAALKYIELNN